MDEATISDTAEREADFAVQIRAWLAVNAAEYAAPPVRPWSEDELVERAMAWQRKKAAAGFGAIAAPKAIGGGGLSPRMAAVFLQEERRYAVPAFIGQSVGLNLAMAAMRKHATPAQLERFMAPTVAGDITWCQLFSEPGAGSDLAAARTRAVRHGENWIVNGQKVWSSWAHRAAYGILLARTEPSKPKHEGLTFFVVDMNAPGVEVRPIRQINGKSDFSAVFLTDVAAPDANRIGAEGEGWACAMTVLSAERHLAGGRDEKISQVRGLIEKAARTPRLKGAALDSTQVRARLAQWWVEEQGLQYFGLRVQAILAAGLPPPATMPLMKLVSANKLQQTNAFLMDLDEYDGLFGEPAEMEQDDVFHQYLWGAARRIAGGADEVLLNQLAERALGMPQDVRLDKSIPFDALPV